MPEGPEIRRAADELARALQGQRVNDVYFGLPQLRRFAGKLRGVSVDRVDTRGKAMLTRFTNGLTLYSHNQLYGRWYVTQHGETPDTNRDLRVALHNDSHSAWLYSASDIEVLTQSQLASHPFLQRLGPDVLDDALTAKALAARLDDDRFRRRSLAALYLDQGFLAGIGNYLRSEILFSAGLHGNDRPQDLSGKERRRLAVESIRLSRRSYRTGGVTLPEQRARSLRSAGKDYGEYRFWVFGRDGLACRKCGTRIDRVDAGSRGLFYCRTCQPRKR
ncbi:MAG: endonuclease VIII [Woeseia sp.]